MNARLAVGNRSDAILGISNNLYIVWSKDKDAARSEDARFLGWVKSYTKSKPAP